MIMYIQYVEPWDVQYFISLQLAAYIWLRNHTNAVANMYRSTYVEMQMYVIAWDTFHEEAAGHLATVEYSR